MRQAVDADVQLLFCLFVTKSMKGGCTEPEGFACIHLLPFGGWNNSTQVRKARGDTRKNNKCGGFIPPKCFGRDCGS